MIAPEVERFVKDWLFRQDGKNAYVILDGAAVPDLPQKLWEHEPVHICLYRGKLEPDLAETAPYLVQLAKGHPFTDMVIAQGWGRHWGIFLRTAADMKEARKHFRKFLMVRDAAGEPLYFAYYDPRVLRIFLPTCEPGQLEIMFGPIDAYLAEGEDPATATVFRFGGGKLLSEPFGAASPAGHR